MVLSAPLETWGWFSEEGERPVIFWICIALLLQFTVAVLVLLKGGVKAPYGRYADSESQKNGIMDVLSACKVNGKVAWILQEVPTLIFAAWGWLTADPELRGNGGNLLMLGCFVVHYVNRTIIHPLRMRGGKPTPLGVMLLAMLFCSVNGYVQCRCLTKFVLVPLWSPLTIMGTIVWLIGLLLNLQADDILRNLRKPGETGYKIPKGGLFNYVSGANFAAEILEWSGFAVGNGFSLPGVMFAFCTACNIGPRGVAHHEWYLERFGEEYPKDRRAVIPFIY